MPRFGMGHVAPPDPRRRDLPGSRLSLPVAIVAAATYYTMLLIGFGRAFVRERPVIDVTFNSMLDHLLHGRFDVDPIIVGTEGFARGAKVYAYWGPLPALLRLPLVGMPDWQRIDITLWSCLIATTVAVAAKLWTLRRVEHARDLPRWLGRAMAGAIVLSGAQVCFLRPSLYQEVCLWAAAFGAIFVAAAVAGRIQGFGQRHWIVMAMAAGAALLTRVSVAIGLIAAFGLILAVAVARRPAAVRAMLAPVAILAVAGALTGYVNYERWGDSFTFADYAHYLSNPLYPERLVRMERYGLFNPERIPFGLVYYLLPVWVLPAGDGHLILSGLRDRLIDVAELPPSSFLLTDPLLLMLAGLAMVTAWRRRRDADGMALTAGLAIPPLLMLTAVSMCFRYRLDFYPLLEFAAFAALAAAGASPRVARGKTWIIGLAVTGVVMSHLVLALYYVSEYGPPQRLLRPGIVNHYAGRLQALRQPERPR